MELLDEKERKSFLEQSGYRKVRNKMMNSMSMIEYLKLLQDKFSENAKSDPTKEIELVDKYIKLIEESKESVSTLVMKLNNLVASVHRESYAVDQVRRNVTL